MAFNSSQMTGVLSLNNVTPVIKALFGPYELDENFPSNQCVYIAYSADQGCPWDTVLENLRSLAKELNLALPVDAEDNLREHLHALNTHFNAGGNTDLSIFIDHGDLGGNAALDTLFIFAMAFDDGHGLKSYSTESAWYCNRPMLFEFGGSGAFRGLHVEVSNTSSNVTALGENLNEALTQNDTAQAADILLKEIDGILSGVFDELKRTEMRSKLSELMANPNSTD